MREAVLTTTDRGLYCPCGLISSSTHATGFDRAVITHAHCGPRPAGEQPLPRNRAHGRRHAPPAGRDHARNTRFRRGPPHRRGGGVVPPGGSRAGLGAGARGGRWRGLGWSPETTRRQPDALSEPFEPVRAPYAFVTECTFGLPVFRCGDEGRCLPPRSTRWWSKAATAGRPAMLGAYASARRNGF